MEFIISVLSSIVAAALLAATGVLWRKLRENRHELKAMLRLTGKLPDISGRWNSEMQWEDRQGENKVHNAAINLSQYGGAVLGTIWYNDIRQYRFRGVFDGKALTAYFWAISHEGGDVGTLFLKCDTQFITMQGTVSALTFERDLRTRPLIWHRVTGKIEE